MKHNAPQIKVQLILPTEQVGFKDKMRGIWELIRADKPIGILLLMWPALWALWIAGQGNPDWYVTLVFIAGSVLVRSAGCAMNDFADRRIDTRVIRTCMRPIASGVVRPREALMIFAGLILLACMLVFTLNLKTVMVSLIALLLALVYPYTKRYTHFPQLVLGLAFGWMIPMSFSALEVEFNTITWLLFAATTLWVLVYDTEYAMVDRDEDRIIGIKSTAILFGDYDVHIIAGLQAVVIILLLLVGVLDGRSWFYLIGIVLTAIYFVRQQQLMKRDKKNGAFLAFQNNNCFGMTVFLILMIDYLLTS